MMREAFSVGIVLMAKDMYSSFVAKAQRDITQLGRVSKVQADEFSRSLAKWQKFGAVGLGITAASAKIAGVFEDLVRTAGQQESSISRAFIQMGDSAGISREKLAGFFSEQKLRWGLLDEDISSAVSTAGGRLGDYSRGLDLVGVAATLSAARQMALAQSTDIVATLYQQFGNTITGVNTEQDKFRMIASEVSTALKSAGGDTDELGSILGTFAVKAAGAGQSLETVLGLIATLGASGAGPRFAMGFIQLFDKMAEWQLQRPEGFAAMYPTAAKTGDAIDFLTDIQSKLNSIGATDAKKQFLFLNEVFGEAAPAISFLLTHMDQLTAKVKAQSLAGKDLTGIERAAADQMETWDGVQKRLHGRVEEFKEMLGSGALPIVKSFDRAVGGMLQTMTGAPPWVRTILAGGVGVVGLGAEASKVVGPVMDAITAVGMMNLNRNLATALKAAGGGAATGAAGVGITGAASAGVSAVIGAAGGVAALIGIIITAIGITAIQQATFFAVGQWIAGKLGITTYSQWQEERNKRAAANAPGAGNFLMPEVVVTAENPRTIGSVPGFASGGPVKRTGLAFVHQGEYVLPRHAAGSGGGVSIRIENITVSGTGHLDYDVRALARAIIRVLPGELKAQARRYA